MRIPASVGTADTDSILGVLAEEAEIGLCAGIRVVPTSNTPLCTARFDIEDGLCALFNGFPEHMELFIRILTRGCEAFDIPFKIEGRTFVQEKWDENYGRRKVS